MHEGRAVDLGGVEDLCGIEVMPASRMIAPKGKPRQTLTTMTEISARRGLAEPDRQSRRRRIDQPRRLSAQLMMLYWVSNIHFQVIELKAIGR